MRPFVQSVAHFIIKKLSRQIANLFSFRNMAQCTELISLFVFFLFQLTTEQKLLIFNSFQKNPQKVVGLLKCAFVKDFTQITVFID